MLHCFATSALSDMLCYNIVCLILFQFVSCLCNIILSRELYSKINLVSL